MTLLLLDSTNVADIPAGAQAVAGYVGGAWPTWAALIAKFPHLPAVSIAVNSSQDAQCLDVERGDATPADVPGWLQRQSQLHPNRIPILYTSAAQVDAVRKAAGTHKVLIWSAHYTGHEHICSPAACSYPEADATQFTDHGPNDGHYDQSSMSQHFLDAIAHRGAATMSTTTTYKQNQVVQVTRCGQTFRASIHTIAALDRTLRVMRRRFPWARLKIFQPCYHLGFTPSAGTHDFDCVLDVQIVGLTWNRAQRFLRNMGWAAWHRTPAQGFSHHVHMALIPTGLFGHPDAATVGNAYKHLGLRVGEFIDGGLTTAGHIEGTSQIVDYFNHAEGLAGEHFQGYDRSFFPPNIAATVYKFNKADLNLKGIVA